MRLHTSAQNSTSVTPPAYQRKYNSPHSLVRHFENHHAAYICSGEVKLRYPRG